jgi:hemerythrin-like domain-containing protein
MDAITLLKQDHKLVKDLLGQLAESSTRAVKKRRDLLGHIHRNLKELIEHHIEEEEQSMFKDAKKLLSRAELNVFGADMEARKAQMLAELKAA